MNTSEIFANHFAHTTYDDLDAATIEWAKVRTLDSFGVVLAGVIGEHCQKVCDMFASAGEGPATVLGFGKKLAMQDAAMVNSLMMRSHDFDAAMAGDLHGATMPSHGSAVSFPVVLALTEALGKSGKDFLCALSLADDFAARLVLCSRMFPEQMMFDNTGTTDSFGTIAGAGKLLGLTPEQYCHAMGIMVNMIGGTMSGVLHNSMTFKLSMAHGAQSSVLSARMAQLGYTSFDDPIKNSYGFFHVFDSANDDSEFTDQLGKTFLCDNVIKPFAGCRETHMGNSAVLAATDWTPIEADNIERVEVFLCSKCPGFLLNPFPFGSTNHVEAAFSASFTAATAVLYGEVRPEHFMPDAMLRPELGTVLDRLSITFDENIEQLFASRARITMKDGSVLEGSCDYAYGDRRYSKLSKERVLDKYYKNCALAGVPEENARKAADMILRLEQLETLDEVIDLLS